MSRGLKCPRCKQSGAWLEWGSGKTRDGMKRFSQKRHNCGYSGAKHYYGNVIEKPNCYGNFDEEYTMDSECPRCSYYDHCKLITKQKEVTDGGNEKTDNPQVPASNP